MTTSSIAVSPGSGKNVATHAFTGEDAVTKEIQRIMLALASGADAIDAAGLLGIKQYLYNGAAWEAEQSNQDVTLLASAARTATTNSPDQTNPSFRGAILFVNVTSITATPSVTPSVAMKDSISAAYGTLWTATVAIAAAGAYIYLLYPGAVNGNATEVDGIAIPRTWRLTMTHADADSITYSVSAAYIR